MIGVTNDIHRLYLSGISHYHLLGDPRGRSGIVLSGIGANESQNRGRERRMNRAIVVVGLLLCILAFSGSTRGDEMIDAVTRFADTVVEHGRDRYGEKHTPMFVDVLNVDTLESPEIPKGLAGVNGPGVVMSNFAYQQNLLRTLVALSRLSGEDKYRLEAEKATRHLFEHHIHKESGLFYWGVHTFLELEGDSVRHYGNNQHEVKSVYPFYEFLYEVDPEKTERFIKSMWLAHIEEWPLLTFNRHGAYRSYDPSKTWDHAWDNPGPDVRVHDTCPNFK